MLPIPVTIALVALREAARALVFPLRVLLHFTRWKQSNERARRIITSHSASDNHEARARFAAKRPAKLASHVFLSCGEASGEAHAVSVMQSVEATGLELRWSCFGGSSMEEHGGALLYPLSQHAIMGVSGVLRALPFIIRALARYLRLLRDDPPDLVILVDYPGLHLIMGRLARRRGIPVLHYIAPQYWAWASWRMQRYRHCMDATLTILPFEAAFFEESGVSAEYVGHPLLDQMAHADPGAVETGDRPMLCMMPGSRRSEITTNVPAFVRMARKLRADFPDLRIVAPHTREPRAALIASLLEAEGASELIEVQVGSLTPWLRGARAVLAKSGTGSLEACLHDAPTVVVYQMKGWFTEWAYPRFITVPWIALPNLIAGRTVVPEHVFRDPAGWDRAEQSLRELLTDGPARQRCLADYAEVREKLGEPGASDRVASWVAAFYGREDAEA